MLHEFGRRAVEAAIKFARAATGRPGIGSRDHAFHGLSYGALSLSDEESLRSRFEPLLPGCVRIPFNDLDALERALHGRQVAAFIVEPIQGKGVNLPAPDYLKGAAELCRRHGTLFIADEIQTGLGRTGRFLAIEHWNVEPDMVLVAKALSGGHVPCGAVLMRRPIFEKMFNRMDRAVVHGSTFAKNDLAMAAGIATLDVIVQERLIENAARTGERIMQGLAALVPKYEMLREVRGKGLMIGVEFGAPESFRLKASWSVLETANKGLFCQLITIPLFKEHKILCQVAGHASHTIKLLPAFVINDKDCDWIVRAFDEVIAGSHRVPGAIWSLGKTLIGHSMRRSPSCGRSLAVIVARFERIMAASPSRVAITGRQPAAISLAGLATSEPPCWRHSSSRPTSRSPLASNGCGSANRREGDRSPPQYRG